MTQHLLLGKNVKINAKRIKAAHKEHNLVLKIHGNGKENIDCSKLKFATGDTVIIFARAEANEQVPKIDLCKNYINNEQIYQIFQDIFKTQVSVEVFTNDVTLVSGAEKYLPKYSTLITLKGPNDHDLFNNWCEHTMLSVLDVYNQLT